MEWKVTKIIQNNTGKNIKEKMHGTTIKMVELNPNIFIIIMYLNKLKHYIAKIVRMDKMQDYTICCLQAMKYMKYLYFK